MAEPIAELIEHLNLHHATLTKTVAAIPPAGLYARTTTGGSTALTLTGIVSGPGGLFKIGEGTLVLGGTAEFGHEIVLTRRYRERLQAVMPERPCVPGSGRAAPMPTCTATRPATPSAG